MTASSTWPSGPRRRPGHHHRRRRGHRAVRFGQRTVGHRQPVLHPGHPRGAGRCRGRGWLRRRPWVGDFNSDSFADLAIGVPAEGVGGAAQAGAVNVLYGATGGLTATEEQQWLQGSGGIGGVAEVGDQFEFALTSGDFNNDTFGDLAIGAPFEDVGTVFDAGAINVVYGSAGRLTATGNQQWLQGSAGVIGVAEANDFFGAALAAGDFNNDTFADLAVGAPSKTSAQPWMLGPSTSCTARPTG